MRDSNIAMMRRRTRLRSGLRRFFLGMRPRQRGGGVRLPVQGAGAENIDGSGGVIQSTVNCVVRDASPGPKEWHNAFWTGRQVVYGQVLRDDNELRFLSANLDVVAHEMFHGITNHTSRLEYAFQPGALNESYSDIFGTIVANVGKDPRLWNWQFGENLLVGDKPFRDLSDPTRFGQPAHMKQFQVLPNTRRGSVRTEPFDDCANVTFTADPVGLSSPSR